MLYDKILKDYGWCQVKKRHDEYFICYDKGGIAVKMVEMNITREEAEKAVVNQQDAENVIRQKDQI